MPPIVTTSRKHKSKGPVSPVVIVLTVVVIVAAVIYTMRKPSSPEKPEPVTVGAATIQPSKTLPQSSATDVPTTAVEAPTNVSVVASVPAKPTKEQELFNKTNNYVKKAGQMMLPNGRILTFAPPKEGTTTKVISNGHIYECDSEGNFKEVTPPPIFDNKLENQLVGLSTVNGTFMPAMLKNHSQEEIVAMLKKPVEIKEDDTPEVVAKKEAVAEMKGIILDYLEQGGTFDQFVDEMHSYVREERALKSKAYKRILRDIREGKIEEARKFRDQYDEILEQHGYSKLTIPGVLAAELNKEPEQ